uniref:F-box domain-containing protein n=1 Tax=Mycena chlorophos TaxID=658473 RepID=A0ABQ0LY37_MYCCL|nr:predicted protein [Mycena chlorophos]
MDAIHPHLASYGRFAFPSDNEAASIRRNIIATEKLVVQFTEAVAFLSTRIRELEVSVAHQKSIVSPARKLPDELLGRVFSLVDKESDSDPPSLPAQTKNAVVQVNAKWRAAALATPSLWSSILINPASMQRRPMFSLLSRQLEWSRPCPLTISYTSDKSVVKTFDGCLRLLLDNSDRWHIVRLSLNKPDMQLFKTSAACFPSLEALDLPQLKILCDKSGMDLASRSPMLRCLVLEYVRDFRSLLVPWHRLATLAMKCVPDVILKMLGQLPQLSAVYYSTIPTVDNLWTRRSLVLCPRLELLILDPSDAPRLISWLCAPLLVTLKIRGREVHGPKNMHVAHEALLVFLETSRCSLTEFELWGCDVPRQRLREVLAYMPDLRSLSLREIAGWTADRAFVEALACDPDA